MTIALPVLPEGDLRRLAAVASRMASDHDGEALNACRMTVRTLGKHSLRIEDVLSTALRRVTKREKVASAYEHQRLAIRLLVLNCWSPREREFLQSLSRWRGRPTEKQRDWLATLAERAEEAA